jgi:hypothetical protein
MLTKRIQRPFLTAAAALLLASWGTAELAAQPARELRILVIGENREDLGYVNPGQVLNLPPGARVRLRMQAVYGGNRSERYPSTRFTEGKGSDAVYIAGGDQEVGNARLEVATRPRNREEVIRYQILDRDLNIPRDLMNGSITVRVDGNAANPGYPGTPNQPLPDGQDADLVRALYRGILMRDPDASGASNALDKLRREGRSAVAEIARGMAESQESRYGVYDRTGVSQQQRLNAIYENLLGLAADDVDRDQYNSDFERLSRGNVVAVVDGIVRSERFRERFRLDGVRY